MIEANTKESMKYSEQILNRELPASFSEEGFLKRYCDFMPNAIPIQIEYARDLFHRIVNDTDTSKVTVSAGRCGLGKSTVVQTLISYFLLNDRYKYRGAEAVGAVNQRDSIVSQAYMGKAGGTKIAMR